MENNFIPIAPSETFLFSCSRQVSCFNDCCRDLNQFLTPFDLLRLKNRFEIPSNVFLERFTTGHIGPESGLPVITLKTDTASQSKCPFVTPSGCSVYEDRPSSCRMYPLMRVVSKSRETGNLNEQYFLIKEPHCMGFHEGTSWTVQQWLQDQEISIEAIIQKEAASNESVPIVILTHRVKEAKLNKAMAALENLEEITGAIMRIRVEPFHGEAT